MGPFDQGVIWGVVSTCWTHKSIKIIKLSHKSYNQHLKMHDASLGGPCPHFETHLGRSIKHPPKKWVVVNPLLDQWQQIGWGIQTYIRWFVQHSNIPRPSKYPWNWIKVPSHGHLPPIFEQFFCFGLSFPHDLTIVFMGELPAKRALQVGAPRLWRYAAQQAVHHAGGAANNWVGASILISQIWPSFEKGVSWDFMAWKMGFHDDDDIYIYIFK